MLTNKKLFKFVAVVVGGAFISVVAISLGAQQMLFMAAIIFLIPSAAFLLGRLLMKGITAERHIPTSCAEGELITVILTLRNDSLWPKFFLKAVDRLPRWVKADGEEDSLILQLEPGRQRDLQYTLVPQKRGVYLIGPMEISSSDPFGFNTCRQMAAHTSELLVYPTPLPVTRNFIEMAAFGQRGDEGGIRRGNGMDFHGMREYGHGDELRRVHWPTSARIGKLVVTEHNQGSSQDVLLALDLSKAAYHNTGEGVESALEYAVKIAATLINALVIEGHTVRLLTPDTLENGVFPAANPWQGIPLMEVLARAEASSNISLPALLDGYRSQALRGATLVYITTENSDPVLRNAVANYEAFGMLSHGFVLNSPSFRTNAREAQKDEGENLASLYASANIRIVHCGDDLAGLIEGASYARK